MFLIVAVITVIPYTSFGITRRHLNLEKTPPADLEADWMPIENILSKICKAEYDADMKTKKIYLRTTSLQDFISTVEIFQKTSLNFHTYQINSHNTVKVILKNILNSISEQGIHQDLENCKFLVIKVKQFTKKREEKIIRLLIFFLELERNPAGEAIHNVNKIFNFNVLIEKYTPRKRPMHCFNRQEFGHFQGNCFNEVRCIKCGNNHKSNTCQLKPDQNPKCLFCSEQHVTSHRGCKVYQLRFHKAVKPTPKPTAIAIEEFPIFIKKRNSNTLQHLIPLTAKN
ncbi:Nucleic-acid-binding protein from transposon X-element, partial [Stegodyphus mimosarum]